MDPYLERHWLDVHASLIYLAKVGLQRQLGDDLVARSKERLVVEPLIYDTVSDPVRQRFIEIRDASSGGRVVTVIEFVSPTNKLPGDGRMQYRRKQDECINARVNLVEIDLTREGQRELLVSQAELPPECPMSYMACAYRATWKDAGRKEVDPISIRERLPAIKIPLRAVDPDVVLDLQPLIDESYLSGRYDRTIDYSRPPIPPLDSQDADWADQLLRAAAKR